MGQVTGVAFQRFHPGAGLDGQIGAIFVIILAAAEAAIALAIVLNVYSRFGSIRPDDMHTLRD